MPLIDRLGTQELVSLFGQSRLAENLKLLCLSEAGAGVTSGRELEEMVRRESGAGMFQTAAGEIARCIAVRTPARLLDMISLNPRSDWPLALFTSLNLEKCGGKRPIKDCTKKAVAR